MLLLKISLKIPNKDIVAFLPLLTKYKITLVELCDILSLLMF